MDSAEWMGLLIGAIIVSTIQFTIGNPFIWMQDKWEERKWRKWREKNSRE